ncbi:hypothetical protein NDU88_002294 [Pleurodeles waltl]|uniref:Uncharacterized protein n=1 Tax=Pleurodeles waltl TaxID=8319 RepID=A0AAV7TKS2_PLEWA|nr:hypothetical protein NDU88_002294 [Pleurodeles waltl]
MGRTAPPQPARARVVTSVAGAVKPPCGGRRAAAVAAAALSGVSLIAPLEAVARRLQSAQRQARYQPLF